MLCRRDDFFKQYCKEQSAEELYEQIDLLNRNLVGNAAADCCPRQLGIYYSKQQQQ